MGAIQLIAPVGNSNGVPVNQSGGTNVSFNPDGTCSITTGANMTPVNWMSGNTPQAGIGDYYWIKFTDTGLHSGSATGITNNNVIQPLSSQTAVGATGGAGSRNYSYIIYKDAAGTLNVASGTGVADNTA